MKIDPFAFLTERLTPLQRQLDRIETNQEKTMAAIDDLKAAVLRLTASTSTQLKAIADRLANSPDPDGPDIEAAVQQLNTISDELDKETATLTVPAA